MGFPIAAVIASMNMNRAAQERRRRNEDDDRRRRERQKQQEEQKKKISETLKNRNKNGIKKN